MNVKFMLNSYYKNQCFLNEEAQKAKSRKYTFKIVSSQRHIPLCNPKSSSWKISDFFSFFFF